MFTTRRDSLAAQQPRRRVPSRLLQSTTVILFWKVTLEVLQEWYSVSHRLRDTPYQGYSVTTLLSGNRRGNFGVTLKLTLEYPYRTIPLKLLWRDNPIGTRLTVLASQLRGYFEVAALQLRSTSVAKRSLTGGCLQVHGRAPQRVMS